jgi:hypothetical protein
MLMWVPHLCQGLLTASCTSWDFSSSILATPAAAVGYNWARTDRTDRTDRPDFGPSFTRFQDSS